MLGGDPLHHARRSSPMTVLYGPAHHLVFGYLQAVGSWSGPVCPTTHLARHTGSILPPRPCV